MENVYKKNLKIKNVLSWQNIIIILLILCLIVSILQNIFVFKGVYTKIKFDKYISSLYDKKQKEGIASLTEINENFLGWISIDDLNLSMPIVKTNNRSDEIFYSNHDLSKQKQNFGCPYQSSSTNIEETDNTLIIGHSAYQSMLFWGTRFSYFGKLNNYLNNSNKNSHTIKIETLTSTKFYKVMSVIKFDTTKDYSNIALPYATTNFNNVEDFNQFYNIIKQNSVIDFNQSAHYGDKFLTLFTSCKEPNFRLMVVAKAI